MALKDLDDKFNKAKAARQKAVEEFIAVCNEILNGKEKDGIRCNTRQQENS